MILGYNTEIISIENDVYKLYNTNISSDLVKKLYACGIRTVGDITHKDISKEGFLTDWDILLIRNHYPYKDNLSLATNINIERLHLPKLYYKLLKNNGCYYINNIFNKMSTLITLLDEEDCYEIIGAIYSLLNNSNSIGKRVTFKHWDNLITDSSNNHVLVDELKFYLVYYKIRNYLNIDSIVDNMCSIADDSTMQDEFVRLYNIIREKILNIY